jgi:hypothetical protein
MSHFRINMFVHELGILTATEVQGTFRVNGSNKRMRDLQAVFEAPPRVRIFTTSVVISILTIESHSTANHWIGNRKIILPMTSRVSSADI